MSRPSTGLTGGPTAPTPPGRFPVQPELDGDFALADLVSLASAEPSRQPVTSPELAQAALTARVWRLPDLTDHAADQVTQAAAGPSPQQHAMQAQQADARLLYAVETSALWRPPVHRSTAALSPTVARAWLHLAAHWTHLAAAVDDLRYFNTACKLLGAVWTHAAGTGDPAWRQLHPQIATVAHLVDDLTRMIAARLTRRLHAPLTPGPPPTIAAKTATAVSPVTHAAKPAPSIVVLAGAGSSSVGPFCGAAHAAAMAISGICSYASTDAHSEPSGDLRSAYDSAWYPPEAPAPAPTAAPTPDPIHQTRTHDWDQVADTLKAHRADLVVLAGMPIVPAPILQLATLGVINAHNGRLPDYRGMDAVGWALLNGDPITCTAHLARPAVDAGEVLAAVPVPYAPPASLRRRVKTTQLQLLLAVARHVTAYGSLPTPRAQPATGARQFYRLHPHLKRLLDDSPYGTPAAATLPPPSIDEGPRP